MKIENIATITYMDSGENEEACAIIRKVGNKVALCISLKSNGDIETILEKNDVLKLIEALNVAINSKTSP